MTMAEDKELKDTASVGQGSPPPPVSGAEAPPRESLIDAVADLLQMLVNWIRAEASDLMRDKFVLPLQQLGLTLVAGTAAGCLAVVGLNFVFVALLLLLAQWLSWPGALLLVGGVILAGAGIFTSIKMRKKQK